MEDEIEIDYLYKVIVTGSSRTGKTQLISRLTSGHFSEEYHPSFGASFTPAIWRDSATQLKYWDLCGNEKYKNSVTPYFKNGDLAIFVYSIDDEASFSKVREQVDKYQELNQDIVNVGILLGHKRDLAPNNRKVPTEAGEALALELNLFFLEYSSKLDPTTVLIAKMKEAFEKYEVLSQAA